MEQRTYTVYTFDELPEESKQKAIEQYYDINVDYGDWWYCDGLLDPTAKEMASRRITSAEYPSKTGLIRYSSKIYFEIDRGNYIQFDNIIITQDEVFRKWLRIPPYLWRELDYSFDNSGRETNTEIVFTKIDDSVISDKEEVFIERAREIFADKVWQALASIRKNYEYLTSETAIIETLKANEYIFTIDGKID